LIDFVIDIFITSAVRWLKGMQGGASLPKKVPLEVYAHQWWTSWVTLWGSSSEIPSASSHSHPPMRRWEPQLVTIFLRFALF